MTRTLQSRVLTLAGAGVFVAAAVLSLLSRQSLLALEAAFRVEQNRVAAAGAAELGRDLVIDLETLQSAISAPQMQEGADTALWARRLPASARELRLADGVCYADATGGAVVCEPDAIRPRLAAPELQAAVRDAIRSRQPRVSPFVVNNGSPTAVAVVPALPDGTAGAVVAAIGRDGARMRARLPADAYLRSDDRAEDGAPVAGTPWVVRVTDSGEVEAAIDTFRRRSLWFAPSLSALAVLLAWGIVLSVQRPVQALTRAAERIARGDLSKVIATGGDEIGRLATALEHMRVRLKASIEASERVNAELERRVEERTSQLQRLLGKVISAQEDERRRVARELHDETSQVLTGLGLALHAGAASGDPKRVQQLQALVDRMHEGLHRVIVNLRPAVLDDLGVAAAIEGLADSQLRRAGIAARCELGELQDWRTDPSVEIAIFRIVQESITNIVRHAQASTVLIQGGGRDGRLWIEIEDDGCGFDAAGATLEQGSLRGVGLAGMRERADLIGGRLEIDSAPGAGTRIRIEVTSL